jgi:hypothetical protein
VEERVLLGDVGAAFRDKRLDHRTHLGNMFGRARLDRRIETAERRRVLVELTLRRLGDLADGIV